jgi:hypothetical protein
MEASYGRLFRGVWFVALATLLYEIALIRVLSFTIWYHFAYVVISTALLGYGASGAVLAWRPQIGSQDLERTLARTTLTAGLTGIAFFGIIALFPFDPLTILTSKRDLLLMVVYEIGATVPFFFSGLTISLALRAGAARVDRLYFWDLVGAGLGCALAVPLMNWLSPPGAMLIACGVFAAAAIAFHGLARARVAAGIALVLVVAGFFGARLPIPPAPSKSISLHIFGQKMVPVFSRWTALFRTDVVERQPDSPLTNNDEWGLSSTVKYKAQPMQAFVTHDGTAGTSMYDLRQGTLDFLEDHILKMPYLLTPPKPRVLIIGVGGGRDVITAVRFGASKVKGVELDPVTIEVIRDTFSQWSNGLFSRPEVELVAGEGRHFIEREKERYDIIQITGVDTLAAQTSGAYVLAENYLYTREALSAYIDHLTPDGVLSINNGAWDPNEPQASGRMLLVAREALLQRNADPEKHIAVIASRRLMDNLLVKPAGFTPEQIEKLESESKRLDFLPLVLPGRDGHPLYKSLMRDTGEKRKQLLGGMRYILDPVTDDSPFFFRFFRWGDLLRQTDYGPAHTSALGQLVLLVLLVSLIALSGLFIAAPLLAFRRRSLPIDRRTIGMLTYFMALGLGFMLLEISLMQRLVLYLGYPTYALSVVLFSLLVFLGAGSYLSRRLVGHETRALLIALGCVFLLVVFYRLGLPMVEQSTLGAPLAVRILITLLMLAPLGLVLGIFFPLGIRRAESIHPDLVPWAWGINGCASVTASVLAVIIAMGFGFGAVWLLALITYSVGILAFVFLSRAPATATA